MFIQETGSNAETLHAWQSSSQHQIPGASSSTVTSYHGLQQAVRPHHVPAGPNSNSAAFPRIQQGARQLQVPAAACSGTVTSYHGLQQAVRQHHVPSGPNSTSAASSGIQQVARQLQVPVAAYSGTVGTSWPHPAGVPSLHSQSFTRPPWQNNKPFVIQRITNIIKKCAGCPFELRDNRGPPYIGLVLQHKERDVYFKDGAQHVSGEQNRYYRCHLGCVQPRHPYFTAGLVDIPAESKVFFYVLGKGQSAGEASKIVKFQSSLIARGDGESIFTPLHIKKNL